MKRRVRKAAPPTEGPAMVCPRCDHELCFGTLANLMDAPPDSACPRCGFLVLEWQDRRMQATQEILAQDAGMIAALQAGRFEELERRLDAVVPRPEKPHSKQ